MAAAVELYWEILSCLQQENPKPTSVFVCDTWELTHFTPEKQMGITEWLQTM